MLNDASEGRLFEMVRIDEKAGRVGHFLWKNMVSDVSKARASRNTNA